MPARLHLAPLPRPAGSARPPSPIRVVLVEDHAVMRRNLRVLLEGEDGVRIIAEATNLPSVVHYVRRQGPHVLVLDLHICHGSSLDTVGRLREEVPDTGIVVLTMEPSPLIARQALDAGAAGFVLKDRADSELLAAVRNTAVGGEYVSPQVATGLEALGRATSGADAAQRYGAICSCSEGVTAASGRPTGNVARTTVPR